MSILCESCPCAHPCGECKVKECKKITIVIGRGHSESKALEFLKEQMEGKK